MNRELKAKLIATGVGAVIVAGTLTLSYQGVSAKYEEDAFKQNIKQQLNAIEEKQNEKDKEIEMLNKKIDALHIENIELKNKLSEMKILSMRVTAYDLSEQSCNKGMDAPDYGITATGVDLENQTLWSARAIAVDSQVIPLNSKVHIQFENPDMAVYNGVYTAVDTGGAIKGNKIDLFVGDAHSPYPSEQAVNFGVQEAKVIVL